MASTTSARSPQSSERVRQIAQAALAGFKSAGYRLTQVAHITERMGVSVGLVYRYVANKEALFHLAALQAIGKLPDDLALPVEVSGVTETVATIRTHVEQTRAWPVLEAALRAPPPANPKAEASSIGAELYDVVSQNVEIIWLLDRCAHDIPALAEIFDDRMRNRYQDNLVSWVMQRGLAPSRRRNEAVALARGAMEAVTWLARNRRSDRTAATITEQDARDAAIRIFANTFDDAPNSEASP